MLVFLFTLVGCVFGFGLAWHDQQPARRPSGVTLADTTNTSKTTGARTC